MCQSQRNEDPQSRNNRQEFWQQEAEMQQRLYPNLADLMDVLVPPQRPDYVSPLTDAAQNFFQEVGRIFNKNINDVTPRPTAPPPPPTLLGDDDRHGHRHPRPEGPWQNPHSEMNRQSRSQHELLWQFFDPRFFFNFFSKVAHCCLLSGSFLVILGILFCLPHSLLAFGTFAGLARLLGLRFGPILFGAASLGFLMSLPTFVLVLFTAWIFFKTILVGKNV